MWSVSKLFGADRNEPQAVQPTPGASPLTATRYDEQYYREHADAGLDYLNHGFWHESRIERRRGPLTRYGESARAVGAGAGLALGEDFGCRSSNDWVGRLTARTTAGRRPNEPRAAGIVR